MAFDLGIILHIPLVSVDFVQIVPKPAWDSLMLWVQKMFSGCLDAKVTAILVSKAPQGAGSDFPSSKRGLESNPWPSVTFMAGSTSYSVPGAHRVPAKYPGTPRGGLLGIRLGQHSVAWAPASVCLVARHFLSSA